MLHGALLQKWLSEEDLHTYKAEFRRYKEKTDILSAPTIWADKELEVDAHVWWGYWGSGKKALHDFATRVTSQPVSIGSAERCWKAYANIHCAKIKFKLPVALNEKQKSEEKSSLECTIA
jgi:hypothetical protein